MDALGEGSSQWRAVAEPGTDRRAAPRPRPLYGARSIVRHKVVLLLCCLLGLAAGLLYVWSRPVAYTASVQLLVYNRQITTGPDAVVLPGTVDVPLVQNQIELLRSRAVLSKVIDALDLTRDPEYFSRDESMLQRLKKLIGFRPGPVVDEKTLAFGMTLDALRRKLSVRRVGTSHTVQMNITASRPEKAARIGNEAASVYLQERRRAMGEAPAIRELYQGLGPSAYIISEAEPPIEPDGAAAWRIVLATVLFGLSAGVALAVLLDVLDNTIHDPGQLEHWLGIDCLAVVPRLRGDPGVSAGGSTGGERSASASHALSRVVAHMRDSELPGWRSLGVTSIQPGDGVTTIAAALARLMVASGVKVLLIDAVPDDPTLSRWTRSVQRSTDGAGKPDGTGIIVEPQSGLHVLPVEATARLDPSSTCPAALSEAVRHALKTYERVIVDMPSLVSGADVRALASALDNVLLVVSCGAADCELARQALASAGDAQSKLVGAVLNKADQHVVQRYGDARDPAQVGGQRRASERAPSEAAKEAPTT